MAKRTRAEFLSRHPVCCFCGGIRASEEEDHIPARTLFKARQWPEGFSFPACRDCNAASRHDELLVSVISSVYPDGVTEEDHREFRAKLLGVSNNIPGALQELQMSPNEIRRALRKHNIPRDPTIFLQEYPFLKMDGPIVTCAVHQFARKLFLALHYRHTNRPLSNLGGIAITWFTNIQIQNGVIPVDLAKFLRRHVSLKRGNMELDDQFYYWYYGSEANSFGVYLAFFRESIALLGYVKNDIEEFRSFPKGDLYTPFQWKL